MVLLCDGFMVLLLVLGCIVVWFGCLVVSCLVDGLLVVLYCNVVDMFGLVVLDLVFVVIILLFGLALVGYLDAVVVEELAEWCEVG